MADKNSNEEKELGMANTRVWYFFFFCLPSGFTDIPVQKYSNVDWAKVRKCHGSLL